MRVVTYGPGGFDPNKPNGNVIEEREVEVVISGPDPILERLDELEAEVRGIRERVAAAEVSNADARKVRDAVAGPPPGQ